MSRLETSLRLGCFEVLGVTSELKRDWNNTCKQNFEAFNPPPPPPLSQKFGFTQSYGRSYRGIVPVFIEFTGYITSAHRELYIAYISRLCIMLRHVEVPNERNQHCSYRTEHHCMKPRLSRLHTTSR